MLGRGISLTFDREGSIALPSMAQGEADFVAEGKPIPVKRFDTSVPAQLEPYKLAALSTLTGEMIRSTNAEALVRTALSEADCCASLPLLATMVGLLLLPHQRRQSLWG